MLKKEIKRFLNSDLNEMNKLIASGKIEDSKLWRNEVKSYSEKAVIHSDVLFIKEGLALLMLKPYFNGREGLMLLTLLFNSFTIVSPEKSFEKFMPFSSMGYGGQFILDFLKRKDKSINSMGFEIRLKPKFEYAFKYRFDF